MTAVSGLTGLREVGDFEITTNPTVTSIGPWPALEFVDSLWIDSNPRLESVLAWKILTSVTESLTVANNADLVDIGRVGAQTIGAALTLTGNASLMHIDGFFGVREVGTEIRIANNASLESIGPFPALETTQNVYIYQNPSLLTLGLTPHWAVSAGTIDVNNNPLLERFDGFVPETVGVDLNIHTNDSLMSLDGLSRLRTVNRHLKVYRNGPIDDLTGLASLETVGEDFHVYENRLHQSLQ